MTDSAPIDRAFARLQALASARRLPEIEPSTSYGTPALKVAGNAFIRLRDAATAVLQCPSDQKVLLMEISPDIYFETDHYIGQDAMLIHLDQISDEELSLRLHDAFMFKAPARLRS
jgi:hypothetical protein